MGTSFQPAHAGQANSDVTYSCSRPPPISDLEDEMLDCTVCPRENNSRLSCQLYVNEEDAEPLSVSIPERQL